VLNSFFVEYETHKLPAALFSVVVLPQLEQIWHNFIVFVKKSRNVEICVLLLA